MLGSNDKIPRTICQGAIALSLVATCSAGDKPSPNLPTAKPGETEKDRSLQLQNSDEKINSLAAKIARVRQEIQNLELEMKLDAAKQAATQQRVMAWHNFWMNGGYGGGAGPAPPPSPDTTKSQAQESLQKLKSKLAQLEKDLADAKTQERKNTREKVMEKR